MNFSRTCLSLIALAIIHIVGCSSGSDAEVAELKEQIKQLEAQRQPQSQTQTSTNGGSPSSDHEPVPPTGQGNHTSQSFDPLQDIQWDIAAFNKQFEITQAKYDAENNVIVWLVRMKGSYYHYSFYDFRLLDGDGIEIDKLSSLLDLGFQPATPPEEGEQARLTLSVPDHRILKKTKKIVIDRQDP